MLTLSILLTVSGVTILVLNWLCRQRDKALAELLKENFQLKAALSDRNAFVRRNSRNGGIIDRART